MPPPHPTYLLAQRPPPPDARRTVRIAAVGDLHATVESAGKFRPGLLRAAKEADVLLLAGDLTHNGQLEEARCLAAEVRDLGVRTVCVLGNHDHHHGLQATIGTILQGAGTHVLEGTGLVFTIRGVRLGVAGVKGGGGGFPGALVHEFGESEVKTFAARGREAAEALAAALTGLDADLRVALTHYSPVPATLAGEPPGLYPLLGNHLLGRVIDKAGVALAAHGHAHHGTENGKTPGGVPVVNVAQPVIQAPYRLYTVRAPEPGPRVPTKPQHPSRPSTRHGADHAA